MQQERNKVYYTLLQGQLLEKCFLQSGKVYKETLKKTKITMQWSIFLQKLYKLILNYSELQFCIVSLRFFCSNFKMIKEICECDKDENNLVQARVSQLGPLSFFGFRQF